MRKMIFLQILLVFFACQKDNVMEGQDIQIPLEGKTSEEIPINHLHLFAIDRDNRIVRQETFTHEDIRKNSIHAILPLGRYRLALVANAFDNGINIPGAGNTLESILL